MEPVIDATVYIVDDDADVREALAWLLRSRRLLSECYRSAEDFEAEVLRRPPVVRRPSCLLLDMRMAGMSGLSLFNRMLERGEIEAMPVIFLTGHADIPTAVDTVKRGAFDFARNRFPTMHWWTVSSRRCSNRQSIWRPTVRVKPCAVAWRS